MRLFYYGANEFSIEEVAFCSNCEGDCLVGQVGMLKTYFTVGKVVGHAGNFGETVFF